MKNELEWLKEFERKFFKEGGNTIHDLHTMVGERIIETYCENAKKTFACLSKEDMVKCRECGEFALEHFDRVCVDCFVLDYVCVMSGDATDKDVIEFKNKLNKSIQRI